MVDESDCWDEDTNLIKKKKKKSHKTKTKPKTKKQKKYEVIAYTTLIA